MNTQKALKWFGYVVLVIGILGFIPGVVNESGLLFGTFAVNIILNLIFIITGLIALSSAASFGASKRFFKIFGVIFLVIVIVGLMGSSVLGLFTVNTADSVLHIILAAYALYYGFRME
jgi:hypothetical protein